MTLENENRHTLKIAVLFSGILLSLLLIPAYENLGVMRILFLITYSLFGLYLYFYASTKILKKELVVVYPMVSFLLIITLSHLNGLLYGVELSLNDFSDYPKFILPFLVFFTTLYILKFNKSEAILYKAIVISIFYYSILFLIYFIDGGSFIYSIGLGRGSIEFYRYGGIDHNPNAYAAIAFLLLLVSIPYAMLSKYKVLYIILFSLLIMSAIAAQSRTNLIAFTFIFLLLITFIPIKKISKFILLIFIVCIVFIAFMNIDLYWLVAEGRFDIENDNSFGTRIENSFENLYKYNSAVGFLGIGPGREALDRLDTISYIMYYIRYGYLGIINFVLIHLWISAYFFYFLYINKIKFYLKKDKKRHMIVLINILIPIYTLILNISNEKWIDIKYLIIWFIFVAIGVYSVNMYRDKVKGLNNAN